MNNNNQIAIHQAIQDIEALCEKLMNLQKDLTEKSDIEYIKSTLAYLDSAQINVEKLVR